MKNPLQMYRVNKEVAAKLKSWKTHLLESRRIMLRQIQQLIINEDKLTAASKINFLLQMIHHSPKDLKSTTQLLQFLYSNPHLVPDPWKLNYLAFYCIGENPNQSLISNLVYSMKLNLFNPNLYALILLSELKRRKFPVQQIYVDKLLENLTDIEPNSTFFAGDLESFTDLCLACKVLTKYTDSKLPENIITNSLIPFIRSRAKEYSKEMYSTVLVSAIHPHYPKLVSPIIEEYFLDEGKKNYCRKLFEEHDLQSTTKLFFDSLIKIDPQDTFKIQELARHTRFIDTVNGLLSFPLEKHKKASIKVMEYVTQGYTCYIEMDQILDIFNLIKDKTVYYDILDCIMNVVNRKWTKFRLEDMLNIREGLLKTEYKHYKRTQSAEVIVSDFLSYMTDYSLMRPLKSII